MSPSNERRLNAAEALQGSTSSGVARASPPPVLLYARVRPESLDALEALARATQVRAAVYLREAVDDMLLKHGEAGALTATGLPRTAPEGWPAVQFLLSRQVREGLHALAQRSNAPGWHVVQEGLASLLKRYETRQTIEVGPLDAGDEEEDTGLAQSIVSRFHPEALSELRALADTTRVHEADYWREAVDDLLRKYESGPVLPRPPDAWTDSTQSSSKSTHFLVDTRMARRLRTLSTLTRIRQAALLREALSDLLDKHALHRCTAEMPPEEALQPMVCPTSGCGGTALVAFLHPATRTLWLRCIACQTPLPPNAASPTLLAPDAPKVAA